MLHTPEADGLPHGKPESSVKDIERGPYRDIFLQLRVRVAEALSDQLPGAVDYFCARVIMDTEQYAMSSYGSGRMSIHRDEFIKKSVPHLWENDAQIRRDYLREIRKSILEFFGQGKLTKYMGDSGPDPLLN